MPARSPPPQDRLEKKKKKAERQRLEKQESGRSNRVAAQGEGKEGTPKKEGSWRVGKMKGLSVTGEGPPMGSPTSDLRSRENRWVSSARIQHLNGNRR